MTARRDRRGPAGQMLVVFTLVLVGVLLVIGLVVDGGYSWAQRRVAQNASDFGALAGARVLALTFSGTAATDQDVQSQIDSTVGADLGVAITVANRSQVYTATYVNATGTSVGTVGAGAIPATATGVAVTATKTWSPFFLGALAFVGNGTAPAQLKASADAIAQAGVLTSACQAPTGCNVLPVAPPVNLVTCTKNGTASDSGNQWPIAPWDPASQATPTGPSLVVPLCKSAPGDVGWLDWTPRNGGGSQELANSIRYPDNPLITLPDWLGAQSGNSNDSKVQSALDSWNGKVVLIPLVDAYCTDNPEPSGTATSDCTAKGLNGNGTANWWHVVKFGSFFLQQAHVQGANPACGTGNGSTGCLVGWFVSYITVGPIQPGAGKSGTTNYVFGVQLVK